MGPMMGGSWGTPGWLDLVVLVVLLALALGAVTFAVLSTRGGSEPKRRVSAEEILCERYSRGEIGREQYRAALEDILKDRYVRGELTLEQYEAQLGVLLDSPRTGSPRSPEQTQDPGSPR